MKSIGIYCFTNLINGKQYIGQSKQIELREKQHYQAAGNNLKAENDSSLLHKALRKYGKENFKFEILEYCSIEELNEKEIYWISKLKTYCKDGGYNLTLGGQGTKRFFYDDDVLLYYWNEKKYTLNYIRRNIGGCEKRIKEQLLSLGVTEEEIVERTKEKQRQIGKQQGGKNKREVHQYTLDGEYIKTFPSLRAAGDELGIKSVGNISSAASGRLKTAYGYQWKF